MSPTPRIQEDEATIRRLVGPEWKAAWSSGDAAAVADFYAPDAVVFPAAAAPLAGPAAIEAAFGAVFRHFRVEGSSEIVELEIAGNWAYVRGTYTTRMRPKDGTGPGEDDRGAWLWIVKRQPDGAWKIHRAMGASETPPASIPERP